MTFYLSMLILGLISSFYLFWRLPNLNRTDLDGGAEKPSNATIAGEFADFSSISVVIPARNEEATLPLILSDLAMQTLQPMEIIIVNDGSEDRTRDIALAAGGKVTLVDVTDKPKDWMGKAWACQKGAEQAKGQLILFLDADVRLTPEAVLSLWGKYQEEGCTVSVQPYHRMARFYEQFSLFFNMVLIGANGAGVLGRNQSVGLFGPVILIPKRDYLDIKGHRAAQHTIADDLVLGDTLLRAGKQYRLFLGGKVISFRMYGDGFKALIAGWTKNFATGAGKTPFLLLIPVFLWVTSCMAAPLYILQAFLTDRMAWGFVFLFFYGAWVLELNRIVPQVGNFSRKLLLVYPIFMFVFLTTFLWSLWKKLFHRQVTWKGRKMKPEA